MKTEISEEKKADCQRYINDHPKCTVGEVVAGVFGEPASVLERATLTLAVMQYLLHLLRPSMPKVETKGESDDR